ncbi:MAG: ATP synthase F0 subunit B [Actinomycetota bacterium]|nr:ATP synthase F0 subunit B [Actinomycetota bacterium]
MTVTLAGTAEVVRVDLAGPGAAAPLPSTEEGEESTEALDEGPSPIAPEAKELFWGLGAFLVFLFLMRVFLVPKVKQGMQARYGAIQADHEQADATRQAAQREVEEYETQLVAVKAEAAGRVDAARQQLEGERADRISEANAQIAERRSAAATEAEEAKAAARESIEDAVAGVAARAVELSTGRRPDDATVRRTVADVMSVGAR